MISINEVQDEVIAEFNDFDDWMDRYQLLIDLGNEQEPLDEKYKTEQNLIEGCQSRDLYFIDKIGLKEHLSPTRSNGLLSMVKQMRMYALAFKAKDI